VIYCCCIVVVQLLEYVVQVHNFVETLPTVSSIEHANRWTSGISVPCIYLMHFAQSAHDATSGCRNQFMSEILTENFPEQIEMETSSFLVVAVNISNFRFIRSFWVWGPINRPAVPSRWRTVAAWLSPCNKTCRVSLFVGRQPCDLFSSGGPGMSLGMAAKAYLHIATVPMPRPCRSHAVPLPCCDSALSFVKVRVVAGNIRTTSPTV